MYIVSTYNGLVVYVDLANSFHYLRSCLPLYICFFGYFYMVIDESYLLADDEFDPVPPLGLVQPLVGVQGNLPQHNKLSTTIH